MKHIITWLARVSKKCKGWFDVVFWLLYLIGLTALTAKLGVLLPDADAEILRSNVDIKQILVMTCAVLGGFILRRIIYENEKKLPDTNEESDIHHGYASETIRYDDTHGTEESDPDHGYDYDTIRYNDTHNSFRESIQNLIKHLQMIMGFEPDYDRMDCISNQIQYKECSHSPFDMQSDWFKNLNCYYANVFRITLPEKIAENGNKLTIPEEFRSFYLHFDLKRVTDNEPISIDVIKGLEWYIPRPGVNINTKQMIVYIRVFYEDQLQSEGDTVEVSFSAKLVFQCRKRNKIEKMYVDLPKRWNTFSDLVKGVFERQETRSTNHTRNNTREDFGLTTRRVNLFTKDTVPLKLNDDSQTIDYNLAISCFQNSSLINCPICNQPVKDLGVLGIVLFNSTEETVKETSKQILKYLNNTQNANLREMVNFVIQQNRKYSVIDNNNGLDNNKNHIRIPLGRYDATNKQIIPFTVRDFQEEYDFLMEINRFMRPHLNLAEVPVPDNRLFLLSYGERMPDRLSNAYLHNTMISQLCSTCWNPLPMNFFNYDAVVTIYFFGNSNAGKTVLLCSEYNVLAQEYERAGENAKYGLNELNEFNKFYFDADNMQAIDYTEIADDLKNGQFPKGTSQRTFIPGKLSGLDTNTNQSIRYMFNYYDMPGVQSVENWRDYQDFVYVHSMLDDPLSLGKNSFYEKLFQIYPRSYDPKIFNLSIYLTKIDEYPAFLQEKILDLNQKWKENYTNSNVEYREKSAVYTTKLLEILEEGLGTSFYQRTAAEVIPKKIRDCISELCNYLFNDKKSYCETHKEIIDKCLQPLYITLPDPSQNIGKTINEVLSDEKQKWIKSFLEFDPKTSYLTFYLRLKNNPKWYNVAQAILNYLHGLDVIRDNYCLFRRLIHDIIQRMKDNLKHNEHSTMWLNIYAISSTGYSFIETLNNHRPNFNAEFVYESHQMLQHTAHEFRQDLAHKCPSCRSYLLNENDYKLSIPEKFGNTNFNNSDRSMADYIVDLCENPFTSPMCYTNINEVKKKIKEQKDSNQEDSDRMSLSMLQLYEYYIDRHYDYAPPSEEQTTPAPQVTE